MNTSFSAKLIYITVLLSVCAGCGDLEQQRLREQQRWVSNPEALEPDAKRQASLSIESGQKVYQIELDADAHPEKYQINLTSDEDSTLQKAMLCNGGTSSSCFRGEQDVLQNVVITSNADILCNGEKVPESFCTHTDLPTAYRLMNSAQKRTFMDGLMAYTKQAQAETDARIRKTFAEEFHGQYHLVKIMSHYYEQADPNFPTIDPLLAMAGTQISPAAESKEDCIASAKASIKKRWWGGVLHGGKQVSDNTIIATLESSDVLVKESYICVPVVEDPEVSELIENYTHEVLAEQMSGKDSPKDFVPEIPRLQ